jgi:hypothetical protein
MCLGVYEGGSGAELGVPYIEGKILVESTRSPFLTPLYRRAQSGR